jgi:hypothetical protein
VFSGVGEWSVGVLDAAFLGIGFEVGVTSTIMQQYIVGHCTCTRY